MSDINFPSSPSGGDTYTYNNITFTYDGEKWTAKAPVTTTSTYGDANVAAYSSAQGFIDLTDISVTSNSPSGNGSLSYNNGSGVFTFTPADASGSGGGSTTFSGLTDTTIANLQTYQVAQWSGSAWVNQYMDIQHLADVDSVDTLQDGDILKFNAPQGRFEFHNLEQEVQGDVEDYLSGGDGIQYASGNISVDAGNDYSNGLEIVSGELSVDTGYIPRLYNGNLLEKNSSQDYISGYGGGNAVKTNLGINGPQFMEFSRARASGNITQSAQNGDFVGGIRWSINTSNNTGLTGDNRWEPSSNNYVPVAGIFSTKTESTNYTSGTNSNAGTLFITTTGPRTTDAGTDGSTFVRRRIEIDSVGCINFNEEYKFPFFDGTAGQVLQTDGNGTLSFATVSGGGGSSYGDANVATYLNGNLDSHIIPDTNSTYDIGSAEYKIRHLYLSDNSLYIGSNVAINTSDTVLQANIDGTVKNIAYEDSTSFQPAESDSAALGTELSLSGGNSTALNSTGGNVTINAGGGALEGGQIYIGTESTTQTNIGANSSTKVNLTGTVQVNNQLVIEDGVSERFSSLTGATGVVTHDCDNGHIFYHSSISANFTANFTNLGLSTNYGTTLTLILDQGATARIPSAVQIGGSAQTINWQGGSAPTGTNNGIDAVSFTIFRVSGSYVVLGQLVDFT